MALRAYTLNFSGIVAPAAAMPFLQIVPSTTCPIAITEMMIGVQSPTAGSSAMTEVTFMRRSTASTTGTACVAVSNASGSTTVSGVIAPISELDPATTLQLGAALTATSLTVAGTVSAVMHRFSFNEASGLFWSPIPSNQVVVKPGGFFTTQFTATQTGITYGGYLSFIELA